MVFMLFLYYSEGMDMVVILSEFHTTRSTKKIVHLVKNRLLSSDSPVHCARVWEPRYKSDTILAFETLSITDFFFLLPTIFCLFDSM